MGGVHLREVSASGGSTVSAFAQGTQFTIVFVVVFFTVTFATNLQIMHS